MGDGDLLKAVAKRFDNVKLYGTDISDDALKKLSNDCPDWHLQKCDFRKDDSIDKVTFLTNEKFDLIVLNPPFTCKGSIVENIIFEGIEYRVSTAMFFLMKALKFLAPNGGLYAILPISCVYSIKDRKAWNYLKEHFNACILEESNKVSFTNKCAPSIVLVYVGTYKVNGIEHSNTFDFSLFSVTSIVRGCVRMQNPQYSKSKNAVPLIHTTNLQNRYIHNQWLPQNECHSPYIPALHLKPSSGYILQLHQFFQRYNLLHQLRIRRRSECSRA